METQQQQKKVALSTSGVGRVRPNVQQKIHYKQLHLGLREIPKYTLMLDHSK